MGIAYVGISGLEPMYGGEARLVATLLNAPPRWLNPRIGVGEGKFPALVAARTSPARGATWVPLDPAAFLTPHSVDLLPVSAGTREALHRFGLHTLGQVAALEPNRLVDRFGQEGGRAWNLANGKDDSLLVPLKHEEAVVEWTSFALFLHLVGVTAGGGGYIAAPGLRATGNSWALRGQGRLGVRRLPVRPVAAYHRISRGGQSLGTGLFHRPQSFGSRASPSPH